MSVTFAGYSSAIGSFNIGNSPIEGTWKDAMAGSATDFQRQRVLSHTLAFTAYPMPSSVYIGLTTTLPSNSTGGAEVSGSGYLRRQATFAMSAGRTDLSVNTATMEWPPATAAWGNLGWFEIWDALTAGNRLYWGPLVDPSDMTTPITRSIGTGDIFRLPVNNVQVQAF